MAGLRGASVEPPPGHVGLTHTIGRPDTTGAAAGSRVVASPGGSSRKFFWAGRWGGGSATGVGGAGDTRVNVCPAPATLTQFHQKLEGEEGADLPHTLSGTEAGRDLQRPHPVHLRR